MLACAGVEESGSAVQIVVAVVEAASGLEELVSGSVHLVDLGPVHGLGLVALAFAAALPNSVSSLASPSSAGARQVHLPGSVLDFEHA